MKECCCYVFLYLTYFSLISTPLLKKWIFLFFSVWTCQLRWKSFSIFQNTPCHWSEISEWSHFCVSSDIFILNGHSPFCTDNMNCEKSTKVPPSVAWQVGRSSEKIQLTLNSSRYVLRSRKNFATFAMSFNEMQPYHTGFVWNVHTSSACQLNRINGSH